MTGKKHLVEPEQIVFEDDGTFPNSPLPVLVYRGAFESATKDLADVIESRLAANYWTNSWRNGVYDYAHFHSTTHEVLAAFRGSAKLRLGGPKKGSILEFASGDVIVIPAGVAHQKVEATGDFRVIGAYPDGKEWDVLRGLPGERPVADERISQLPLPVYDPLHGENGPLPRLWKSGK